MGTGFMSEYEVVKLIVYIVIGALIGIWSVKK